MYFGVIMNSFTPDTLGCNFDRLNSLPLKPRLIIVLKKLFGTIIKTNKFVLLFLTSELNSPMNVMTRLFHTIASSENQTNLLKPNWENIKLLRMWARKKYLLLTLCTNKYMIFYFLGCIFWVKGQKETTKQLWKRMKYKIINCSSTLHFVKR